MSFTVDTAFVTSFEALVHHLAQEDQSIRGTCREKMITGKSHNFERLSSVEMAEVTTRHATIALTEVTHSRRRATIRNYAATELIDEEDEVRFLINAKSEYAKAFANAYNRRFTQTLINAIRNPATSVDAADTESTVALPAAQLVAAGGTGFTFEKANEGIRRLNIGSVPQGNRHAFISPHGVEDLLAETEVTSSDFSTLRALMNGSVDKTVWMGLTWHMTTLLPITGTTRSCFFWHHDGVGIAMTRDMQSTININPERNNATQVQTKTGQGGTRIDDLMVVQIDIVE